jgi:adenine deaminase
LPAATSADVVVHNGKVFSVLTREWVETDVAVCDGFIAGLGEYAGREVVRIPIGVLLRCVLAA